MDEEFEALWRAQTETVQIIGQQQALNLRNTYVLQEIVRTIAAKQPDPPRFIAQLFERVTARGEQGEIEKQGHPVQAQFRDATETFFEQAGRPFRPKD
ncbi:MULTISPECIES: hypothetical protein [unclassified Bradyrhizobium]|uniref:hypothetical protein n=1 Tax=unclassified Bradyrhizobium TaxID=2631580 RepID=UPI001FF79140|nr:MULTISPECIES: hypothetical protein [unclassified Bradyrhizobium]MCK1536830.1 hypothetical protein [Bradyrhizobium sp. 176]MCK1560133.1 hypothetical protein [Bradyrhizobium sp. 171]